MFLKLSNPVWDIGVLRILQ